MRLDKFVCKSTELTKPQAVQLIREGQVSVNGKAILDEATQAHENNQIVLHGQHLKTRSFRYILLHKPKNTICSNIDEAYPSIFNGIDIDRTSELHVAGRLDADTTGLVLITDDGRWSFNIIRPSKQCAKIYLVGLSRAITKEAIHTLENGIMLQGESKLTLPATLEVITPKEVLLTITEGKHHQVKRMFAAVGNKVRSLHREKIGELRLDIGVSQWRYLTPSEVNSF